MEKIFLFIKHNLYFFWRIIEKINNILFSLLYKENLNQIVTLVFKDFKRPPYLVKKVQVFDIESLHTLIMNQDVSDLEYFHPHDFDTNSLKKQLQKTSFLMMVVFIDKEIIGYFFLRFFVNKKCFVGRLIDKKYRGHGIGELMNSIMYEIAWRIKFRCFATISRNNSAIMNAHAKNQSMVVLKELQNDFLLVEFKRRNVPQTTV